MTETHSTHEYAHTGTPVQLTVSYDNDAREPRVYWQAANESGDHGGIQFRGSDAVLQLAEGDSVPIGGEQRASLPIPRDIAESVQAERERLETVVTDDDAPIETDPSEFPSEIAGFERAGWEADRNVMWYLRDDWPEPRAYQIENGDLVFRAQEWVDLDNPSKADLIGDTDLIVLDLDA